MSKIKVTRAVTENCQNAELKELGELAHCVECYKCGRKPVNLCNVLKDVEVQTPWWEYGKENNFSNWYPKIADCGMKTPKSMCFKTPEGFYENWFMERPNDRENIEEWLQKEVYPKMTEGLYFIKNGRFSNKFNFKNCIANKHDLREKLIRINYDALLFNANGCEELVLREVIPYNDSITPTIYEGMPFQCEIRVFYDFDRRKVLYSTNYWGNEDGENFLACMHSATDRIIVKHHWQTVYDKYTKYKAEVENKVAECMMNVDMKGQWSIDILVKDDADTVDFWLIDMAVASASAHWDKDRVFNILAGGRDETECK